MAVTEGVVPKRAERRRAWTVVTVIVGALGFLVFQGLGDSTVYFKTVDEAVAERAQLGDRRFRIEGAVVQRPVDGRFTLKGETRTAEVEYHGEVPPLMQPDIPVVLEGRWVGERFLSDRIMVKHTSEYREKNPDRVEGYTAVE